METPERPGWNVFKVAPLKLQVAQVDEASEPIRLQVADQIGVLTKDPELVGRGRGDDGKVGLLLGRVDGRQAAGQAQPALEI